MNLLRNFLGLFVESTSLDGSGSWYCKTLSRAKLLSAMLSRIVPILPPSDRNLLFAPRTFFRMWYCAGTLRLRFMHLVYPPLLSKCIT